MHEMSRVSELLGFCQGLSDMMWEEGFLGNNLLGTEGSAGQTPGPGFDENLNGKGMLYSYCGCF